MNVIRQVSVDDRALERVLQGCSAWKYGVGSERHSPGENLARKDSGTVKYGQKGDHLGVWDVRSGELGQ